MPANRAGKRQKYAEELATEIIDGMPDDLMLTTEERDRIYVWLEIWFVKLLEEFA